MERHKCKVKFHKDKIVCASQILCSDCPEKKKCEDIDVYIDSKYYGTKDCMTQDSYKRKNKRLRQTNWKKD